jgi:hypothetical protein
MEGSTFKLGLGGGGSAYRLVGPKKKHATNTILIIKKWDMYSLVLTPESRLIICSSNGKKIMNYEV